MTAEATDIEKRPPPRGQGASKIVKIAGMQLEIPIGKDVVVRIPALNQTYKGKIVGCHPYDYVIVQVRMPSKVRQELTFSGQLVLKFVHKGSVYGFRASVMNAISSPTSLVFFEYPEVAERIALRRTSRTKCNIEARLETLDSEYDCMVMNVSETGCKISVRAGTRDDIRKTRVGEAMIVSMTLGQNGPLKLPFAVRNISQEQGILSMGAQFLDITADEVKAINSYLDKIRTYTRT